MLEVWRGGEKIDEGRVVELGTHGAAHFIIDLEKTCNTYERFRWGDANALKGHLQAETFQIGDELHVNISDVDLKHNLK